LRLDDEAEQKLIGAAKALDWKKRSFALLWEIVALANKTAWETVESWPKCGVANVGWKN
jgi:hypothetical protein